MDATSSASADAVVIGGGFYGAVLALHLRRDHGARVILVEAGPDLLGRASYVNQARVHGGYHYPRSLLTGRRSRVNAPRFIAEYADCIDRSFAKYYAIARTFSKVTAAQFRGFCERIGAPVAPAPDAVRRLFSRVLVEDVVAVEECAFDAARLRERLALDLAAAGVDLRLGAEAVRVREVPAGGLAVLVRQGGAEAELVAPRVFNCTYARLNRLLVDSGLPPIPLKQELTEMALVTPPPELAEAGVTVMCGPFFSIMPFPPRGLHSFSHVRYTPHRWWPDTGPDYRDPYAALAEAGRPSNFPLMVRDAARYLPAMAECRYVESIWEVKTVLPRSEVDDSRPILLRADHGLPGLTCIMGSKIDNVYDMLDALPAMAGSA